MNPAYSVILFTTLSGAGYGLLAMMAVFATAGAVPHGRWFALAGFTLALGGITAGLLASTFHLGRARRAWRAFSQWRSSWLSREGILAVATYVPALLFAWGWVVYEDTTGRWRLIGMIAALFAFFTVYCTGMIYASLRPVRAWFNHLTVPVFLTMALWTGILWLNLLMQAFGAPSPQVAMVVVIAGFLAYYVKRKYWRLIDSAPPWVTPEAATGLDDLGTVRLLDAPNTQESFVEHEMGYRIARKHAAKLRRIAFLTAFAIPLALAVPTMDAGRWIAIPGALGAVVSVMAGVLVERWLFFAEAKHTAALYYGAEDS